MTLFGSQSKSERMRIKTRVRAAMQAQTAIQGRYLGGRPPYGYRLADAGPHPNPAKARFGVRLHVLEPDPLTAPVVARIYRLFLDGLGYLAIAERLNAEQVPSGPPAASYQAKAYARYDRTLENQTGWTAVPHWFGTPYWTPPRPSLAAPPNRAWRDHSI